MNELPSINALDDLKPSWLKPPLWRWQQAHEYLADPGKKIPLDRRDPYLVRAARFFKEVGTKRPNRILQLRKYPAMLNAWHIYAAQSMFGGARWQVEALILSGATDEDLNRHFPTKGKEDTFKYYRKLFFDVEDYMNNPSAMLASVFSASLERNRELSDCDATWKMMAHHLGYEEFCRFLSHYCGGSTPSGFLSYLREFRQTRMEYYTHHCVTDMRLAFREKAVTLLETGARYYQIDRQQVDDFNDQSMVSSMQGMLTEVRRKIEEAPRRQQLQSALEPVNEGTTLQLNEADKAELETIFE